MVDQKRSEVSEAMWTVEYELGEPAIEGRAISTAAVEKMFDRQLGEAQGGDGELLIFEQPAGQMEAREARYVTGVDWAKERDWTVITTWRIDCRPMRLVAFERCQRLPWPVMIGKFEARQRMYRSAGVHDACGIGNVVEDYIRAENVQGIELLGQARHDAFTEYIVAIERDELKSPRIEFMRSEHLYVRRDDLWTSSRLVHQWVPRLSCVQAPRRRTYSGQRGGSHRG